MGRRVNVIGVGMVKFQKPGASEEYNVMAGKAAANIAAIASTLSMDQFPAGSEYQKSTDSFALPAIWEKPDDFLQKIADLNTAAAPFQTAASTDLASLKTGMEGIGAACGACHKIYRQPEE